MKLRIVITIGLLGAVLALTGCNDDSNVNVGSSSNASNSTGGGSAGSGGNNGGDNGSGNGGNDGTPDNPALRTRYSLNNQCVALQANGNGKFVVRNGDSYQATADDADAGESFFMKPAALGDYLIYNKDRQVMSAGGQMSVANESLDNANDDAVWTVIGVGDVTEYPDTPEVWTQPEVNYLNNYRSFEDPEEKFEAFTLAAAGGENNLAVNDNGDVTQAPASDDADAQSFTFVPASDCEEFPEAQNNTEGETFKGTTTDGSVLGMADVHVHISATSFLGNAEWGDPFSRFGVTRAMGDGAERHGPQGTLDVLGAFYVGDFDGHDTTGWPTFPEWPSATSLTHEAIYWKWLERAWKAGLRIAVNDLVENQTLCELTRNVNDTNPIADCNSMNNSIRQIGTMYAMQDYIDAQYGGRGKGWFQIVLSPEQARDVIEDGKLAVVLGIEISNLFNCQVNYKPLRTKEPFEETGSGALENSYRCNMGEDDPDSEQQILPQLTRLHDLGVRQIITLHEFDNAFGGNGIFNDLILNVGNRENSGGIPSGNLANATALINSGAFGDLLDPTSNDQSSDLQDVINLGSGDKLELGEYFSQLGDGGLELPTGEFWTTYDCPVEDETDGFSGYLFGDHGGAMLQSIPGGACTYTGQGGRPGGTTPCYPARNQCNARWLTPIGLYTYEKIMEAGMIFDFDHMELEIKDQVLELAEAQDPVYPLVSTHGTFGGTSNEQAERVLRGGGFIYPSLGNGRNLLKKMAELRGIYDSAMTDVAPEDRPLFGFGFGTDTNGLSAQASPRGDIESGKEVTYPYTLFAGSVFNNLDEFDNISGVVFNQPGTRDPDGEGRTWNLDEDGSAQYGMLSGMVQEVRLEGTDEQMRTLFNSAERYLRTWERTLDASKAINANGIKIPEDVLRAAPNPAGISPSLPPLPFD